MFWGSLHRTILCDLFKIFMISLVALTGLILLAGVISEAMKSGLGLMQILTAIPLLLPSMLPYTVPTTTLFATCIVYGRLSADNEILALKAAGVHMVHVVWPALVLGLTASSATMYLSIDAIPRTNYLLKAQVAGDVEELLYSFLRKDGFFKHPKVNYEIYVKEMRGRTLCDMQFMRRSEKGRFDVVARAREAELHVDLASQQILLDMHHCEFVQANGTVGYFESRVWAVELPNELNGTYLKSRAGEMNWDELAIHRQRLEKEKQKISHDIDAHQLAEKMGGSAPSFAEHLRNRNNERRNLDSQLFALDSEYHMRAAFALGCLCFALVGCPVGIWFNRTDYLSAFVTCFLPIVTIYYPVMFCTINMSHAGKIPPWLGIYNADGLLLLAGGILFHRLTRN